MTTALQTLTSNFAKKYELGDNQAELISTLKSTAFKGQQVSDAQMTALMLVAKEYSLNPWLNEIYAFPAKGGNIVPIVGVDGWARIMNEHPQFDGIDFEQDNSECTCIIYRKDRKHPIKVTEYQSECNRNTSPWQSHPKRMLRHKTMIQCARLAFGFAGIYDADEAERIIENEEKNVTPEEERPELPSYPDEDFKKNFKIWEKYINDKKKTPQEIIDMVQTKGTLTEEQIVQIRGVVIENTKEDDESEEIVDISEEMIADIALCKTKKELDKLYDTLNDKSQEAYDNVFQDALKKLEGNK